MDLKCKRSCSKLHIRDLGKKEKRIGAEPVPLMLCAIFNLNFKQQTTTNKNVKFLTSAKESEKVKESWGKKVTYAIKIKYKSDLCI